MLLLFSSLARLVGSLVVFEHGERMLGKRHGNSSSSRAEHDDGKKYKKKKQHGTKTNFKLNLFANFPRDVSKNLSEMSMKCVVVWMGMTAKTHSGYMLCYDEVYLF